MLYAPPPPSSTKLPPPHEIDADLADLVRGLQARHPGSRSAIVQRVVRRAMRMAGVPAGTINRVVAQAAYRRHAYGQFTVRTTSAEATLDRLVDRIGLDAVWRAVDRATTPTG